MRVGSLVFDTTQGLGILARSFYTAGVVNDVAVIEHGRRPSNPDWYPGKLRVGDLRSPKALEQLKGFCLTQDVVLFFETPFLWELIPYCRSRGVKTVLMPMYECMPRVLPQTPDLFLCPSLLDLSYYPQGKYLPVPVEVPWRQRTKAEVLVHNAGHGGLRGRNGTKELVEAWGYVRSSAKLILRSQEPLQVPASKMMGPYPIDLRIGTFPSDSLYSEGDVFVFPERFNGLSLPLQEARAAGMLVMATDRFPNNMWLPRDVVGQTPGNPLVRPSGYKAANISLRCNDFEESLVEPKDIAAKIDEWYGRDVTQYSLDGRAWAEENSWAKLRSKYLEALEDLCRSS